MGLGVGCSNCVIDAEGDHQHECSNIAPMEFCDKFIEYLLLVVCNVQV